jgi:hypothetical protein
MSSAKMNSMFGLDAVAKREAKHREREAIRTFMNSEGTGRYGSGSICHQPALPEANSIKSYG